MSLIVEIIAILWNALGSVKTLVFPKNKEKEEGEEKGKRPSVVECFGNWWGGFKEKHKEAYDRGMGRDSDS